jgi:predicted DNA-binding protein YlxM (UPF0122 family)
MPNKLRVNLLLDYYEALLTQRQRTLCDYYFRQDLSYQEIAELEGISRTAVYEAVRQSVKQLETYEGILGMIESRAKRERLYDKIVQSTDIDEIHRLIETCRALEIEGGKYE